MTITRINEKTAPQPSSLLIRNGFIYTADKDENIYPSGSVLIINDHIVAVGDVSEVDRAAAALDPATAASLRTIDAQGKMVLPGFVNAHWHEMFAMRVGFNGALRTVDDRNDKPGFLARGGDMHLISSTFDKFCGLISVLTSNEAEAIARYSMWTQLRCGTTTLGDVGSLNRPEAMAAAAKGLGIRGAISTWASDIICLPGESIPRRTRDTDDVLSAAENLFQICGGDETGLTRARPSAVYLTNMSDELGHGFADLVARFDATFATHIGAQRNESDFVQQYFGQTPIRRLDSLGLVSNRLMAVHCAFVDDGEYQLLVDKNVHINHSPAKYGSSGESTMSETKLISKLIREGLDVSLSTDATVFPIGGMIENMRAAWQVHNEIHADQSVVVPTKALAMATRIAARGLNWEEEIGSLQVGKQADLVLVPNNDWRYLLNFRPLEAFLVLGGSMDVDTVIVAGRIVLEGGRATLVDEEELESEFLDALRSFTARLPGMNTSQLDSLLSVRRS